MKQELVVPRNRIGVVIGLNGKTKNLLEERTNTTIHVDSQEGTIVIEADSEINPDPMASWNARDVIRAISRGFNPYVALKILEDNIFFDFIDIKGTPKYVQRIKGRIIGEGGKTRRIIEETTRVKLSVFGGTVGFIGDTLDIINAKEAVDMLMNGARHATVYRYLNNLRFREKMRPPELWEKDLE